MVFWRPAVCAWITLSTSPSASQPSPGSEAPSPEAPGCWEQERAACLLRRLARQCGARGAKPEGQQRGGTRGERAPEERGQLRACPCRCRPARCASTPASTTAPALLRRTGGRSAAALDTHPFTPAQRADREAEAGWTLLAPTRRRLAPALRRSAKEMSSSASLLSTSSAGPCPCEAKQSRAWRRRGA